MLVAGFSVLSLICSCFGSNCTTEMQTKKISRTKQKRDITISEVSNIVKGITFKDEKNVGETDISLKNVLEVKWQLDT